MAMKDHKIWMMDLNFKNRKNRFRGNMDRGNRSAHKNPPKPGAVWWAHRIKQGSNRSPSSSIHLHSV